MLIRNIAFACALCATLAIAACSKQGDDGTAAVSSPTAPPPTTIADNTATSGGALSH